MLSIGFMLMASPVVAQGHAEGVSSGEVQNGQSDSELPGIVIITHPGTDSDSLSRHQLFEFYTLEKNKWQDGALVNLYELKENTEARQIFYDYLDQKPRDMKKIWMRAVLSGEGRTPRVVRSEAEVIQRVSETPGALGYVSASLVTDRVKILIRISDSGDVIPAGN